MKLMLRAEPIVHFTVWRKVVRGERKLETRRRRDEMEKKNSKKNLIFAETCIPELDICGGAPTYIATEIVELRSAEFVIWVENWFAHFKWVLIISFKHDYKKKKKYVYIHKNTTTHTHTHTHTQTHTHRQRATPFDAKKIQKKSSFCKKGGPKCRNWIWFEMREELK
jgi:hypothetical protein